MWVYLVALLVKDLHDDRIAWAIGGHTCTYVVPRSWREKTRSYTLESRPNGRTPFGGVVYSIRTQNFLTLRKAGMPYVDRTGHICRVATSGRYLLLSRPRRLRPNGVEAPARKLALTVSTINKLYPGSAKRFGGLWAGEH